MAPEMSCGEHKDPDIIYKFENAFVASVAAIENALQDLAETAFAQTFVVTKQLHLDQLVLHNHFSIFFDFEIDELFVLIFCLLFFVALVRFVPENMPPDHS